VAKLGAADAYDELVHLLRYFADDLMVAQVEGLEAADVKTSFYRIHSDL
jgi:hypothetical protein